MKKIINFLLLLIISSCATTSSYPKTNVSPWTILENALNEKWNKQRVFNGLSDQNQEDPAMKKKTEALNLEDLKTHWQSWAIKFNQSGEIESAIYMPFQDRVDFSLENILTRWHSLNCQRNDKQIINGHTINTKHFYSCDGGKRVITFNQYDEVESIFVNINPIE